HHRGPGALPVQRRAAAAGAPVALEFGFKGVVPLATGVQAAGLAAVVVGGLVVLVAGIGRAVVGAFEGLREPGLRFGVAAGAAVVMGRSHGALLACDGGPEPAAAQVKRPC